MADMGRVCTAAFCVLVEESVCDNFVEIFKEEVEEVSKVGDAFSGEMFKGL